MWLMTIGAVGCLPDSLQLFEERKSAFAEIRWTFLGEKLTLVARTRDELVFTTDGYEVITIKWVSANDLRYLQYLIDTL